MNTLQEILAKWLRVGKLSAPASKGCLSDRVTGVLRQQVGLDARVVQARGELPALATQGVAAEAAEKNGIKLPAT